MITAVLTGSAVGLLAAVVFGHQLIAALTAGVPAGVGTLVVLIRIQTTSWRHIRAARMLSDE